MITKRHTYLSVHRCCAQLFSGSIKDDTSHLTFLVASFPHILLLMSLSPNSITSHQSFMETNHSPRHSTGPDSRRMDPSERPSLIHSRIYPTAQELSPFVRHRLPSPISPLHLDGPPVKLPSIHEWFAQGRKNLPPMGLSTTTAGLNLSRYRYTPFATSSPRSYAGPRTARHMPSASVSGEPHFLNIRTVENDLSTKDLVNLAIVGLFLSGIRCPVVDQIIHRSEIFR